MTILEMAAYVNGDTFTRECKPPIRCTPEMYARVVQEAAASETYKDVIGVLDTAESFAIMETDVCRSMPKSEREEMFFCLKNGGYSPDVPAKCIYVLKTLFEKYGSVSLALKALPNHLFTIFFQKNYLNGCCMRDVIKSLIDSDYEPFTSANLRIKHKDYDEVYVLEQDMVALFPKDISNKLTDTDVSRISLDKRGLTVDGLVIRIMAGHYGAVNSIYDLRAVI